MFINMLYVFDSTLNYIVIKFDIRINPHDVSGYTSRGFLVIYFSIIYYFNLFVHSHFLFKLLSIVSTSLFQKLSSFCLYKLFYKVEVDEILLSIILTIFDIQEFKALHSTCSRLHQRLQNSCKAPAISSRHVLKSVGEENPHLAPLRLVDHIPESVIVFKFPLTI